MCKKYCDCRTWHAFHSFDFVPTITGASFSENIATTGFPSIARTDFSKFASSILKVFQVNILVNRHTLRIKMTPKFTMFEDNTTQFFAEFNHPALDMIECPTHRRICCQEKRIKAILNKILN